MDAGVVALQEVNVEEQALLRLIVMGKKSLPDPAAKRGRPYWGYVELVTTDVEHIKDALKDGTKRIQILISLFQIEM